jgi:hypothetical protein
MDKDEGGRMKEEQRQVLSAGCAVPGRGKDDTPPGACEAEVFISRSGGVYSIMKRYEVRVKLMCHKKL